MPLEQTSPLPDAVRRVHRHVWRRGQGASPSEDLLVEEEPLEIRLAGCPIAVVMRTPGHDLELGVGFALTERLLPSYAALERVAHCSTGEGSDNVLLLTPAPGVSCEPERLQRRLYATSSCGVCGKRSIDQALAEAPPVTAAWKMPAALLAKLPEALRAQQPLFGATGGLHAAALFSPNGELLVVREDIGRHNAVDKCVGWAWRSGRAPLDEVGLLVSGRVSYEVVQKALAARISLVAGVGAVSSLAASLATRAGMTLIGFTSAERLCIYAGAERIP